MKENKNKKNNNKEKTVLQSTDPSQSFEGVAEIRKPGIRIPI